MKILLLDNYDSFTFNLVHLFGYFDSVEMTVRRNDEIELSEVALFDRIVFSPGPGIPSEAGVMPAMIDAFKNSKPMFGVCLGLQAIVESCGGKLKNMEEVNHGVSLLTTITDPDEKLYSGFPRQFKSGRYHSWCADSAFLPKELRVTSVGENGEIMSLTHENQLVRAVQYHPESILTEYGKELIHNWLSLC